MSWFPPGAAKVIMQPGSPIGETNALYASMTVNLNRSQRGVFTSGVDPWLVNLHNTYVAALRRSNRGSGGRGFL